MTEPKQTGFQPAPWDARKPNTQGPAAPGPGPGPGPGPQPPAQPPRQSIPLGDGFAEGELGRARTRKIPNQGSPNAPQQPYMQPGAKQQQQQSAPPQQPVPVGPPPQQPYADTGVALHKPVTILGIISLVMIGIGVLTGLLSFGFFSWPFFIIGSILGYLAIRETAPWGRKSGRGLAMGGTIANGVLLVLNVVGVIGLLVLGSTASDHIKTELQAIEDGAVIQERIHKYVMAKGDLEPGGPQMFRGFENETAATGPQLRVTDLVTPAELKNPIDHYSLEIKDDSATIWYQPPEGQRKQVGTYGGFGSGRFDSDFHSDFRALRTH